MDEPADFFDAVRKQLIAMPELSGWNWTLRQRDWPPGCFWITIECRIHGHKWLQRLDVDGGGCVEAAIDQVRRFVQKAEYQRAKADAYINNPQQHVVKSLGIPAMLLGNASSFSSSYAGSYASKFYAAKTPAQLLAMAANSALSREFAMQHFRKSRAFYRNVDWAAWLRCDVEGGRRFSS